MLPGTWLRTGPLSKVTLTLPDRTQTIIARNSEIQLSAPEGGQSTSIKLNIGKLWSKTNKKPVALTIKAPNAVASIRGTEWVFDVSEDGESSVAVMEGFVAVNANDGAFSAVERGEIASVNNNRYRTLGSSFIVHDSRKLSLRIVEDGNDYPIIGMDNEALSLKYTDRIDIELSDQVVKTVKLKNNSFWHKVQRSFF